MLASQFTNPGQTDIDLFAKASGPLSQSGQRFNFWSSLNGTDGITRFFQGTVNSPSAGTVRAKVYLTHGATSSGVLGITSTGSTQFSTEPLMNTDEDKAAVVEFLDSILNAARKSTILVPSSATATGASLVANYVSGTHFLGTAMMGDSKQNAVVDKDTKVFGTDNLFVVDASIHPDLPTGNTQAIVMVVAEYAAAKILALGSSSNSTVPSITPPFANSTIPATTPLNTTLPSTPTESSPEAEDDC
jgi:cellobiose dehydrogenase (acceptor)